MPIPVQTVVSRMASALDAEGSERYTFDQDYKYAISYAQEWIVTAVNQAMSEKKLAAENLRELIKVKIWQANAFSRIAFDPAIVGQKLWSVLAVYPEIKTTPFSNPNQLVVPAQSVFMPNLSFVSSDQEGAARLTHEEWNDNKKNVFMPGNITVTGSLKKYAYLDFADYSSSSYVNPVPFEIEVRPSVAAKYVAIVYLKYPNEIILPTDNLEFPDPMIDLIVEKALLFISFKQGDATNLYSISEREVSRIVNLIR